MSSHYTNDQYIQIDNVPTFVYHGDWTFQRNHIWREMFLELLQQVLKIANMGTQRTLANI